MTNQEAYEMLCDVCAKAEKYDKMINVLQEIRQEIEQKYGCCDICEFYEDYDYEENDVSEYKYVGNIEDIFKIIDKYKGVY